MRCLSQSQLQYLKVIAELPNPTVTTIADYLNYSKPSVVRALKKLAEKELITYPRDIKLTNRGRLFVDNLKNTDDLLLMFLINELKIEPNTAQKDLENLRYAVSCHTISALEKYLLKKANFEKCPKCDF